MHVKPHIMQVLLCVLNYYAYIINSVSLAKRNRTLKLMVAGSSSMLCTMNEAIVLVFAVKTSFKGSRMIVTIARRGAKNGVNSVFSNWFPYKSQPAIR